MITTKIFQVSIDIEFPGKFAENMKENVMAILNENYVNICYNDVFILSILNVHYMSDMVISRDNLKANSTLTVLFEAEVESIYIDEIIPNCKVISNFAENTLVCEKDNKTIVVQTDELLSSVKIGQYINVKVKSIVSQIKLSSIPLGGTLYIFKGNSSVYNVPEDYTLTPKENKVYQEKLKHLEKYNKQLEDLEDKTNVDFFTKLLYKGSASTSNGKPINFLDMLNSGTITSGNYQQSSAVKLTTPFVLSLGDEDIEDAIVSLTPFQIFMKYLDKHINYVYMLYDMLVTFNTEATFASHENIWGIYEFMKKNDEKDE
jgi:hypothetical protein